MSDKIPDLFDDVFGPVMQPGSSSHTAGPCRLGYLAHCLLKGKLKKVTVLLDKEGSFAGTFGHMNEDIGMLSGAYGFLPDDERMFEITEIYVQKRIEYRFEFTELSSKHPNAAGFLLTDENNEEYYLEGNSIGGGRIETVNIMGFPIRYSGDTFLYLLGSEPEHTPNETGRGKSENESGETIFWLETSKEENELREVRFLLTPVTEFTTTKDAKQLFDGFESWKRISREAGENLYETALRYETDLSGQTEEVIFQKMKKRQELLKEETEAPYRKPENILETPFSGYHFGKWDAYEKTNKSIQPDLNRRILKYVFAVQALTKGVRLVPGPMGTGGGFLYSVIRAFAEEKKLPEEKITESLFVAAGVGMIAYTKSDPTGEITGCAGECGICGAMAAAAVTYMAGGNADEIENAASLALQAALGWPCDPVPGGNNQPCFSRFVTVTQMAVTFADLALSGRDAEIPFDEVVETMDRMGREMPLKYRCTSLGGICETNRAGQCRKEFDEWFRKSRTIQKQKRRI